MKKIHTEIKFKFKLNTKTTCITVTTSKTMDKIIDI